MYTAYVTEQEYTERGNTSIPSEESGTLTYVEPNEYASLGFTMIPSEALTRSLHDASRQVDSLTFNRIVAIGFNNLTSFQQEIIKEVVCKHANFLYENKDALASILSGYSINSVSMQFGTGFNVVVENGIPILNSVYSLLKQTGLCCRLMR